MVVPNRFSLLANLDIEDVYILAAAAAPAAPAVAPAAPAAVAVEAMVAPPSPRPPQPGSGLGDGVDLESYFPVHGSNRSFTITEDGEVLDPSDEWLGNCHLPRPKPNTYRRGRDYGFPRRGCLRKEEPEESELRVALQRQFDRHSGILVTHSDGYERRKWMLMREFWQITSPQPETTNSMGDIDSIVDEFLELTYGDGGDCTCQADE